MKFTCPNCGKDVYFKIETDFSPNELDKKLVKQSEGLRKEITRLRTENRELKKKLEDASH